MVRWCAPTGRCSARSRRSSRGRRRASSGAWHLADTPGERGVWVVDVGGTTTDIAALREGRPRLNPRGAQVGGWRTMVEAADVHTVGLGGDSQVRLNGNPIPGSGGLTIGPRRVRPLCMLADEYPEVVDVLRRQIDAKGREKLKGEFVLLHRRPTVELSEPNARLLDALAAGPQAVRSLVERGRTWSVGRAPDRSPGRARPLAPGMPHADRCLARSGAF